MANLPYSKDASAYTDPEILNEERKTFFHEGWVSIGLASTLGPGTVTPAEVAGQPVIITRTQEGNLHVFHNICRHKKTQLVLDSCTDLTHLVCPYHAWTYSLSGELKGASYFDGKPGASVPKDIASDLGLEPVRYACWFDIIFVDLSGTAPSFDEWVAPLAKILKPFESPSLHLVSINGYEVDANWKHVCENFLDNYHVPFVHNQVGGPKTAVNFDSLDLSNDIFGFTLPTGEADKPKKLWFPQIEVGKEIQDAQFFICLFPNTLIALTTSWFQVISVQPKAVDQSAEFLGLYIMAAIPENDRTESERFSELMNHINQQDLDILASLQMGSRSSAISKIFFTPYWDEPAQLFHRRLQREAKMELC